MKTCKTCAAWGGNHEPRSAVETEDTNFCHRNALIANSDNCVTYGESWWCLDYVPITDEQSVMDREKLLVVLDRLIQSMEHSSHKAGEFSESIRVVSMSTAGVTSKRSGTVTMPIDEILSVFENPRRYHRIVSATEFAILQEAIEAAIPILRRAKEVDVELLKRVVDVLIIEQDKAKQDMKPLSQQHVDLASSNARTLRHARLMLHQPGFLAAEAKRLGLEVESHG